MTMTIKLILLGLAAAFVAIALRYSALVAIIFLAIVVVSDIVCDLLMMGIDLRRNRQ